MDDDDFIYLDNNDDNEDLKEPGDVENVNDHDNQCIALLLFVKKKTFLIFVRAKSYFRKMTEKKLCFRHKFGYCKYNRQYPLKHVDDICENPDCHVSKCDLRHPKECIWF